MQLSKVALSKVLFALLMSFGALSAQAQVYEDIDAIITDATEFPSPLAGDLLDLEVTG